jgi:hypothetical protein
VVSKILQFVIFLSLIFVFFLYLLLFPGYLKVSLRKHLLKPDIVVYTYNPSYLGGRGSRILVEASWDKSTRPFLKNKLKAKRLGVWLKW